MKRYIFHSAVLTEQQQNNLQQTFGERALAKDGFYQLNSEQQVDLAVLRDQLTMDVNVLPDDFNGKDIRLLVTDMDSTLISIECIDEIADMLGIKDQVSDITESAMRGEIGFEGSLTRRVALLEGLPAEKLQTVYEERLSLNPGAEDLMAHLQQTKVKTALVSGGFTFFTHQLKQRLGLDYTLANTLAIENGCLTGKVEGDIVGAQSKADLLLHLCDELDISPNQVIAMGDGANDLVMMKEAGLSVAYHAKPAVQQQTDIQINQNGLNCVIDLLKA